MPSHPDPLSVEPPARALRAPSCLADRIGFLLARSHLDAHETAEGVIEPGLSPKHFGCMSVVVADGPLSQQELGERMRVDRTTIVAVVDELERRGFLARRRNPIDRRAYALEATGAGRRWLDRSGAALTEAEARILAPLDPDERQQLIALLRKLVYGRADPSPD